MPLLTPSEEVRLRKSSFETDYQTNKRRWVTLARLAHQQVKANLGLPVNTDPAQQAVAAKLAILLINDAVFQIAYRRKPWNQNSRLYVRPSFLSGWADLLARYVVQSDWGIIKA